ncbi:hypothetical protein [Methylorubrum zatmanii]|uniref:Uncharacterized protein n=1 Tax=Methylorubrum zatmanii TaxID=29429 RepID=A0ABW1WQF3_9HYPH|nr:hypothetical protein [Methylorubrum zatmanii]
MDLTKKLLVEPGSHVRLDGIDAGFTGHFSSRAEADKARTKTRSGYGSRSACSTAMVGAPS